MFEYLNEPFAGYIAGTVSREDLAAEIASFDWNDQSPEAAKLRPLIGRLELLIEEVGEGFRSEQELIATVQSVLEASSPSPQPTLANLV